MAAQQHTGVLSMNTAGGEPVGEGTNNSKNKQDPFRLSEVLHCLIKRLGVPGSVVKICVAPQESAIIPSRGNGKCKVPQVDTAHRINPASSHLWLSSLDSRKMLDLSFPIHEAWSKVKLRGMCTSTSTFNNWLPKGEKKS